MTKKSETRMAKEILAGKRPMPTTPEAQARVRNLAQAQTSQLLNEAKAAQRAKGDKEIENLDMITVWDDLNAMYDECYKAFEAPEIIGAYRGQKHLYAYISDHNALMIRLKMIPKDMEALKDELNAIRAAHEGKTGGTTDGTEMIEAYPLYEAYRLWLMRFEAVVLPSVQEVVALFTEAEARYQTAQLELLAAQAQQALNDQEAQQAALTDPDVITDVEVDEHGKGKIHSHGHHAHKHHG